MIKEGKHIPCQLGVERVLSRASRTLPHLPFDEFCRCSSRSRTASAMRSIRPRRTRSTPASLAPAQVFGRSLRRVVRNSLRRSIGLGRHAF